MKKVTAPTDAECEKAWKEIAAIARSFGLVVHAYGGTMILALPEEQRRGQVRERVLAMHGMEETT